MGMHLDPVTARDVIAGLRGAPKEFNKELRVASKGIAGSIMVPAYATSARMNAEGRMGAKQGAAIRARSDRIPKVAIGSTRRSYSGGASSIQTRYKSGAARWLPAARSRYSRPAMDEWLRTVERMVASWNRGGVA